MVFLLGDLNMVNKYFLPPDVFIRHWLIAREINKGDSLLDVGGSLGELRKFITKLVITTTDVVEGADVIYSGEKLPFENDSFDYVASIDTLEHIPPKKRLDFVSELVRVAKQKVVIIAPFASPKHIIYEANLMEELKRNKRKISSYLIEHRKYGLINREFTLALRKKFRNLETRLLNNVFLDEINFKIHGFEVKIGKLNRLIYLSKFLWNVFVNIFAPITVKLTGENFASRVLITIPK